MARIAGVDLPRKKHVAYALPYIYGVGKANARVICKNANVSPTKKVEELTDAEVKAIREAIEADFKVEKIRSAGYLEQSYTLNIKDCDSHPIVEELGLRPETFGDLNGFYLDMDFVLGCGRTLWRAETPVRRGKGPPKGP